MTANFLWNSGTSNDGKIAATLTLMTTELESVTNLNGIVSSVGGASGWMKLRHAGMHIFE